jgi:hypothetical protein
MPYQCFADDGQEAILLVTNLAEGDTLGVCPEHLPDWAQTFLTSVTGREWAPVEGSTEPTTGDATDEDEAADGGPVTPAPAAPEPTAEPEAGDSVSDDEDQAEEGQLAEDNAVRDADLRQELAGHSQR